MEEEEDRDSLFLPGCYSGIRSKREMNRETESGEGGMEKGGREKIKMSAGVLFESDFGRL